MIRPLFWVALFYALGIFLGRYFSFIPFLVLLFVIVLFACWHLLKKREGAFAAGCLLLIFFVAGGLAYNFALESVRGDIRNYAGERCVLVGMVEDEPIWQEDEVIFILEPESIIQGGEQRGVSGKVQVQLSLEDIEQETEEKGEGEISFLSYGEKISLQGSLYEPRGRRNPGGFDYRFFLEAQGVSATFYGSVGDVEHIGISEELSSIKRAALETKERMSSALRGFLPQEEGGLLIGVLFGERGALHESTERSFRSSGVSHLLAVSGLHVGLVAAIIFLLGKKVGITGAFLYLLTAFLLFCYVFITGFKPSTLRAFIMFLVGMGAVSFGRQKDFPSALAAASLITLIYNPLLLFNIGFQLSYAAVSSIMVFNSFILRYITIFLQFLTSKLLLLFSIKPVSNPFSFSISSSLSSWFPLSKICTIISVTLSAQLGVLPLTAFYFQEVSIISFLTNLFIVPVIALLLGLGLTGGLMGMVLPVAAFPFCLAAYPLLSYILIITGFLGSLPFSYREVYPPSVLLLAGWYLLLIFFLVQGHKSIAHLISAYKNRVVAYPFYLLLILLSVFLLFSWLPVLKGPGSLEVTFLDVGQGDSIFIRTPRGQNILLDGGGKPSYMGDVEEVGERVVVPFLLHQGVKEIDLVIVSHPHEDHYGGLIPVLEEFPVNMLVTNSQEVETESYNRMLELAKQKDISRETVQSGDILSLDSSIELRVLHPPAQLLKGTPSDVNNNSLVLQMRYKETSILFTGDIEEDAVDFLLERKKTLNSSILKVPHHGGYFGNISCFLNEVAPKKAIITVGSNPFGHPHEHTIHAFKDMEGKLYRTDYHGAIMLHSRGYEWDGETMIPFEGKVSK